MSYSILSKSHVTLRVPPLELVSLMEQKTRHFCFKSENCNKMQSYAAEMDSEKQLRIENIESLEKF